MLNVAIAGATGYTGKELINILLRHPDVRITGLFSTIEKPRPISEIFPEFKDRIGLICRKLTAEESALNSGLVFLALPHTVSMKYAPKLLKQGKKVIDLSSDYRLKNQKIYETFYKVKHRDALGLKGSVYGLPELYRQDIKSANLIANPGCYAAAAILALAPLAACDCVDPGSIIIDAKSGVTGAGKKSAYEYSFAEINEDFRAYKVNTHQHMPEINQELSKLAGEKINITFVPHLLPVNRGILETIYIRKIPAKKIGGSANNFGGKIQNLNKLYRRFYQKEPFVRIRNKGEFPRIKDVVYTNFCDIGITEEPDKIIIIAAIDNLLKGASGQAVQNMNIMYGFPEYAGLL